MTTFLVFFLFLFQYLRLTGSHSLITSNISAEGAATSENRLNMFRSGSSLSSSDSDDELFKQLEMAYTSHGPTEFDHLETENCSDVPEISSTWYPDIWRLAPWEQEALEASCFKRGLLKTILKNDPLKFSNFIQANKVLLNFEYEACSILRLAMAQQRWEIVKFLITCNVELDLQDYIEVFRQQELSVIELLGALGKLPTIKSAILQQSIELLDALIRIGRNPWTDSDFLMADLMRCPDLHIVESVLKIASPSTGLKNRHFLMPNEGYSLAFYLFSAAECEKYCPVLLSLYELVCKYGPIPFDLTPAMLAHLPLCQLQTYYASGIDLSAVRDGSSIMSYFLEFPFSEEVLGKLEFLLSKYPYGIFQAKNVLRRALNINPNLTNDWMSLRYEFQSSVGIRARYLAAFFDYYDYQTVSIFIVEQTTINPIVLLEFYKILQANRLSDCLSSVMVLKESQVRAQAQKMLHRLTLNCTLRESPLICGLVASIEDAYGLHSKYSERVKSSQRKDLVSRPQD